MSGATVTLTASGFSTRTLTTGSDGCAYFPGLSAGTYTATVSDTGYVSQQEVASPTVSAVVGSGTTVVLPPLAYAPAGLLEVTGTVPAALTPASGLTYSVGNTALQPLGWYPAHGRDDPDLPVPPLGRVLHLGGGLRGQRSPGGGDRDLDTALPRGADPDGPVGGVGAGGLHRPQLYALPVSVEGPTGAPVGGATATAVPDGADCQTPTASYGLVPTAANGLGTTGVPLGHFTVAAASGALRGSATVWVTPTGLETAAGVPFSGPLVVTL